MSRNVERGGLSSAKHGLGGDFSTSPIAEAPSWVYLVDAPFCLGNEYEEGVVGKEEKKGKTKTESNKSWENKSEVMSTYFSLGHEKSNVSPTGSC